MLYLTNRALVRTGAIGAMEPTEILIQVRGTCPDNGFRLSECKTYLIYQSKVGPILEIADQAPILRKPKRHPCQKDLAVHVSDCMEGSKVT